MLGILVNFLFKIQRTVNSTAFKPMLAAATLIAKRANILVISFRRLQNHLRIFQEVCLMNISNNRFSKIYYKMCLYVWGEYLKLSNEGRMII